MLDKNNLTDILPAIHQIDLLVIIPANLLTLFTGLMFSKFAGWGFFKHGWITLKYAINLIPCICGAAVFTLSILNMLAIANEKGGNAINDSSFVMSMNMFISAFIAILLLLIFAVILSVTKPKIFSR